MLAAGCAWGQRKETAAKSGEPARRNLVLRRVGNGRARVVFRMRLQRWPRLSGLQQSEREYRNLSCLIVNREFEKLQ